MPRDKDEPILLELRRRFDYASDEWRDIRKEGTTDMRYVAGDPWDEKDRRAREDAGRPVLSLDELGQYVNQLINEVRQHKRAIKVTAKGAGANDATANLRANLIRQIEYQSNAQQAYTAGFENTVQRSYGFWRIKPQYVAAKGQRFHQELVIDPLPNPDLVLPDPDILSPDGKDLTFGFISESWPIPEFKRKFPKAEVQDFTQEIIAQAPAWFNKGKERVQVSEYWTIKVTETELILLQVPDQEPIEVTSKQFDDDERVRHSTVLHRRPYDEKTVQQYLTNGLEILKKTDWCPARQLPNGVWLDAATSIPLICCYGKVLYVDRGSGTKKELMSLPRLARDAAMLMAYYRTQQAEMAGMMPKVPVMGYKGQFREVENQWQKAPHEPMAFLEAQFQGEGWNPSWGPMPLPGRLAYDAGAQLQALELCAEGARRAIQSAMATNALPTQAQRRNEKSGIALQKMEESANRGSFHFIDHYEDAITRTGTILNELLPHYYDAARDVAVRSPGDVTSLVRINDPAQPDQKTGEVPTTLTGDHDVTLSTGPSMASERVEASEFADVLAQNPQIFPLIGPLVVKLKNLGPIGDEIAEALEVLQPPEMRAKKQQDGQPPDPAHMQAQLQQLQAKLQQAEQFILTEQAKQQAAVLKAKADNETKLQIAKLTAETDLTIEMIKAGSAEKDRQIKVLEAMIGADKEARLEQDARTHEHIQNLHDQAHEVRMAHVEAALAPKPEPEGTTT